MKKEIYQKPTMTVIEMRRRATLLTASEGNARKAKEWDGELGYIPGFTDDTHLA